MTRRKWIVVMLPCAACTPDFQDQPYLVERVQLLAVVAEPAEVRPGAEVVLTPVVTGRRLAAGDFTYHFCTRAPEPADPRPISETCLDEPGAPLEADGKLARGNVPADACARFGPDPVGSAFRPHDADGTGGFYQPILVKGLDQTSVALLRITCPLPDAPIELSRELQTTYLTNQNPEGIELEARAGDTWGPLSSAVAGDSFQIRVSWDTAAREHYVWLPPDASKLENRREAFSIAWFVTAGSIASAATVRDEHDPIDDSSNTFTAPARAGNQDLWAVVHDDRGGTAVLHRAIAVRP